MFFGLGWELDLGIRGESRKLQAGGNGFLTKPEDQTDTLLLRPGFMTRAIAKHALQERSPFPYRL